MNRHIPLLSLLLVVQLALVAGVFFWQRPSAAGEDVTWFDQARTDIDRIRIEDGSGRSVVLVKAADGWRVQATGAGNGQPELYPADAARVQGILDRVAGATLTYPVATSTSAARRFDVADNAFQRRITLRAGEVSLGEYYLGSSPGIRRVHARRGDANAIHAIEFAVHDAPVDVDEWLDKNLLRPSGPLSRVAVKVQLDGADNGAEQWTLLRDDGLWRIEHLDDGERTRQVEAEDWVRRLSNLRVFGVGTEPPGDAEPVLQLAMTDADGERSYRFYQPEVDGDYLVAASHQRGWYRVADYLGGQLRRARADLVAATAPAAAAGDTGTGPADDPMPVDG
jgi:hypothetical protein